LSRLRLGSQFCQVYTSTGQATVRPWAGCPVAFHTLLSFLVSLCCLASPLSSTIGRFLSLLGGFAAAAAFLFRASTISSLTSRVLALRPLYCLPRGHVRVAIRCRDCRPAWAGFGYGGVGGHVGGGYGRGGGALGAGKTKEGRALEGVNKQGALPLLN